MDVCTIIARNYLAHARVLAESVRRHRPSARCFVLVIDGPDGAVDLADEPFEVLTPDDLSIDTFERMAALYHVLELSTAVKPWLLRHLLAERGSERLLYLDPDIRLYDDLAEVDRLLEEHSTVVTPHLTDPMPRDGKRPSETDILTSGSFNLGFIGVSDRPETYQLLDWWGERLETDCIVAPEAGYFVDQRWMDFAPGLLREFCVLRDPGYNVAYWNLPARGLEASGSGFTSGGRPLRFFHFSGYDPDSPDRLSKHQDRLELSPGSALERICRDYRKALLAAGYREVQKWPYRWADLPNGVRLDAGLRAVYREAVKQRALPDSVFTRAGAQALIDWANGPAPEGGAVGVTRYLSALRATRKDLQADYPDLDGPDAARLVAWAEVHGRSQMAPELAPDPARAGDPTHLGGVNVAGYFRSVLGVGEHARLVVRSLESVGVPVSTMGLVAHTADQGEEFEHSGQVGAPHAVNLVSVNADVLPDFARQVGHGFFAGRYTIGLWAWEVTPFPAAYAGAFDHVDEVWVLSRHVADAIRPLSPVPVLNIRLPVEVPELEPRSRTQLGLPEGYLFMLAFDHESVFERKNPLALIDAFTRAFEPGSGAALAIKTMNAEAHPEDARRLREAAAEHPDVQVIDAVLPRAEKDAMIASCDCYVSLHRAEGFGISLAEAMWLGKPVIATGFSGNLDYMTEENSRLVDHTLVQIGPGHDPYPPEGQWADPDTEHAARLMRAAFDDPDSARALGARGRDDIRASHSFQTAGRIMARRLGRAQAWSDGRRSRMLDTGRVARLVSSGPVQTSPPTRVAGVKRAARQLLLRVLKPYTVHQRRVDDELLTQIHALETAVLSLAHSQARIDRLAAEQRRSPELPGSGAELREHPLAGVVSGFGPEEAGDPERSLDEVLHGSERAARDRLAPYPRLLAPHAPVIVLGCGRGELLDLLRDAGIAGEGVEPEPAMARLAEQRGHAVTVAEPSAYLEACAADTVGAIFCASPGERLDHAELLELIERARVALRPEGLMVLEAVNPHCTAALKTFAADPSRHWPLFPEVALALARGAGYESAFVYHPSGTGNVEADRFSEPTFALVATAGTGVSASRGARAGASTGSGV